MQLWYEAANAYPLVYGNRIFCCYLMFNQNSDVAISKVYTLLNLLE